MSKKILIIDDEEDVRLFLKDLMTEQGYDTVIAMNGREGLDVAVQEEPDLILLDLMMPDQTGTDFCRRLRRKGDLADTPIIVVSGYSGRNYVLKDPVAVFDKPFDPKALVEAVNGALSQEGQ